MNVPDGYRLERGLLWPASDITGAPFLFAQVADIASVYPHCRKFDVAVQAGGNCGLWPKALGEKFAKVYTFEPDPMNFRCLCTNAPAENIFKFNASLGAAHCCTDLVRRPDNIGAHQIGGKGDIPMLCIDDLSLPACDLIYLDIEGAELNALLGAQQTIIEHSPVIVIEDKDGLENVCGVKKGQAVAWLVHGFEYRVADHIHRDVVLVP